MIPEMRRELIRLANREDLTAEDVEDLCNLGTMLLARIQTADDLELVTAQHVLDFWKESFR